MKYFDRVKVNIATLGTGDVTFGTAVSSAFLTPSQAGAVDGDVTPYVIVDGTDFEEGTMEVSASGTEGIRTVSKSVISGVVGASKLNLSGTATITFTVRAADLSNLLEKSDNLAGLTDADDALDNLGGTTVGKAVFTAADAAAARTAIEAITGSDYHAASSKTTPVDADEIPLVDSAASWGLKKLTWANLKAALIPQIVSVAPTNSGRLSYTSTTALAFKPYNGDTIKINGSIYQIPSAGIAGLGNPTSIYLNGVAAQTLAVNTTYYIYVFNNSGTLTADFSTTGHSASSTSGNIGTEIKTGDDTRSLIGMVRTGATVTYLSDITTLSWFNRKGKVSSANSALSGATPSTPKMSATNPFLCWNDEVSSVGVNGRTLLSGTVGTPMVRNYIDGSPIGIDHGTTITTDTYMAGVNTILPVLLAEGYHEYAYRLSVTVNSVSTDVAMYISIRG